MFDLHKVIQLLLMLVMTAAWVLPELYRRRR
jgi:hypothetical protein